jgi:hypothetical protein
MPALLLQLSWDTLTGQVGTFSHVCCSERRSDGPDRVLKLYAAFSRSVREVRLVVRLNARHRIVGFSANKVPYDTALTRALTPSYVSLDTFVEHEITVGRPPWTTGGTITSPAWEDKFPAVLLLNTDDHHDRDGLRGRWRDLAWGLATQGIAVLRYDHSLFAHPARDRHRGHLERDGLDVAPSITVPEEYFEDALTALKRLQEDSASSGHLFLVGHGLGGYLLPRLAHAYQAPIGLVNLFGYVRPPWEVQAEAVARILESEAPPSAARSQLAARLQQALLTITQGNYRPDARVAGKSGAYWTDLRDHHGHFAVRPETPVLVIGGDQDAGDHGVSDFLSVCDSLRDHPRAEFLRYTGLNSGLTAVPAADFPSDPRHFSSRPFVDARLIKDLARWIRTTSVV